MPNLVKNAMVSLLAVLIFGSYAVAQNTHTEAPGPLREGGASILDKLASEGTGGAAPQAWRRGHQPGSGSRG